MTGDRIARAQELLVDRDLDLLLVAPSADFRYLTGRRVGLTERLTALLLPARGRPTIVVPRVSEPLLEPLLAGVEVRTWEDGSEPLDLVVSYIEATHARRIGVGEELWSHYLLELTRRLPTSTFDSAGPLLHALRVVKQPTELELLREASHRLDQVLSDFCANETLGGRTESEIATILQSLVIEHGLTDTAWCDVGSGANSASPLHVGGDRRVEEGDPVVIDLAAAYDGYFADICRTIVRGKPSEGFVAAYQAVKDAQQAAVEYVRPGRLCGEVDGVARRLIAERGYGQYFVHRLGHGIGLAAHEHPYLVTGNEEPLEVGMTFSIEPGIYIQGKWGVRIEDIVAVTQTGAERFNEASRELLSLPASQRP